VVESDGKSCSHNMLALFFSCGFGLRGKEHGFLFPIVLKALVWSLGDVVLLPLLRARGLGSLQLAGSFLGNT
jgi:hypothetical protein